MASTSQPTSNLWADILDSVSQSHHHHQQTGQPATVQTQQRASRKNLIVLGEPRTGKSTILDSLLKCSSDRSGSSLVKPVIYPSVVKAAPSARRDAAMGYDWVDVREEGDEETLPPLSILTAPSSHPSLLDLIPLTLSYEPSTSSESANSSDTKSVGDGDRSSLSSSVLKDTAVLIVLDWTKPGRMITELLDWLEWVDLWAEKTAKRGESEENRERLQYHLQHYNEPPPISTSSANQSINPSPSKKSISLPLNQSAATGGEYVLPTTEVLPLGPGTLTKNSHGIPITIVCTKSDQIDTVAEELGLGGPAGSGGGGGKGGKGSWEERTDWIGQVLRVIGLMYGASLFYTSQNRPESFTLLRSYIIHRLFSSTTTSPQPPPTDQSSSTLATFQSTSSRFPFPYRANIFDRDRVVVPAGWDSWGKIQALGDGFDPVRITDAWEAGVKRRKAERTSEGEPAEVVDEEVEDIEDLWEDVVPDLENGINTRVAPRLTTTESEQAYLSRHYEIIQNDLARDPSRGLIASRAQGERSSGVVGPMGSDSLSLPNVQEAMALMNGSTPTLGKRDPLTRTPSTPVTTTTAGLSSLSSTVPSTGGQSSSLGSPASLLTGSAQGNGSSAQAAPSTEVLHQFFQSLLTSRKTTPAGVAGLSASTLGSSSSSSTTTNRNSEHAKNP